MVDKSFLVNIFGIVFLAVILKILSVKLIKAIKRKQAKKFKAERRKPLTKREQEMYRVIKSALDESAFIVLSQVSMQALITTPQNRYDLRNRYSRKYSDFVICTPAFFVIAVIELDDWSHVGKEDDDAERDAMLASAGIPTIRYKKIPDAAQIRTDIRNTMKSLSTPTAK